MMTKRLTREKGKQEIGVLYGFRALMVLFVMNYHIWQQSWLGQTATILGKRVSFDFWTRSSFVFVDGMILLSGLLLFLPHARSMAEGTQPPDCRRFYFNRAVRILPSYWLAIVGALVCIALPQNLYASAGDAARDMAAHLSFTFLFWPQTYLFTPLNVALWTIAVEMQFYLLFPLLARWMRKKPVMTSLGMMAAGLGYRLMVALRCDQLSMYINQMPAFLDVYALGMLSAIAYVRLQGWLRAGSARRRRIVSGLAIVVFALGGSALLDLLRIQSASGSAGYTALQLSQMRVRLPLALTLGSMMLAAASWPTWLQKCLDNRLMRFLSCISMNLYIWHQVLAVEMRKAWFPDTELLHRDPKLQSAYTLLCVCVAVLAAMAVTYGVEQPISRWANRQWNKRNGGTQ